MADAYLRVKDNGAQGLALVREETDTSVSELKNALQLNQIVFTTDGRYFKMNGDSIDPSDTGKSSNFKCVALPCNAGDKFTIHAKGSTTNTRPWAFINENNSNEALLKSSTTELDVFEIVTAPPNATTLLINNIEQSYISYYGEAVIGQTHELYEKTERLEGAISQSTNVITENLIVKNGYTELYNTISNKYKYIDVANSKINEANSGSNATLSHMISVPADPDTEYVIKKYTSTTMRAASGAVEDPADDTPLANIAAHSSASDGALYVKTGPSDHYLYIQLWSSGNSSELMNNAANIKTLYVEENVRTLKNLIENVSDTAAEINADLVKTKSVIYGTDDIVSDDTLLIRSGLPSYFVDPPSEPDDFDDDSYVDVKIEQIPEGKRFVYFTDTHWRSNAKHSPELIQYVRQRKNIRNVVFGGDFIGRDEDIDNVQGKFRARQLLGDFAYKMLCTAGSAFLPVFGNHDNNFANYSGEIPDHVFFPYSQTQKIEFSNLPKGAHTQYEYEADRVADYASGDDLTELIAYLKMSYFYDDNMNGIRYIVLNSHASEPVDGPIKTIFGSAGTIIGMMINLDWLYYALVTTPSGYDVIMTGHEMGHPDDDDTAITSWSYRQAYLAMALKTKTSRTLYISMTNYSNEIKLWMREKIPKVGSDGNNDWTFDFTNANNIGRIILMYGHVHRDGISIINQSAVASNKDFCPSVAPYNGTDTVDQTLKTYGYDGVTNVGCAIPIIWTQCDAYGRYNDGSADHGDNPTVMTEGTITEQAFDVVTLTDSGVDLTRFGAGENRHIEMVW